MPHFLSLFKLLEYIARCTPESIFPLTENGFEWVDWNDPDGGRIAPSLNSNQNSPFLFRGQTSNVSPCYPSIYRGLEIHNKFIGEEDLYKLLERKARMYEFISILKKHPAVQYSKKIKLHVDYIALSQHYGLSTEYLDLTNDIGIAAFFASHEFLKDSYKPVFNGIGIIYKIVWPEVLVKCNHLLKNTPNHLEMIGNQLVRRPTKQSAWAYVCSIGENFENENIEKLTFERNKNDVLFFSNKYNFGKDIFPEETLYNIANRVRSINTIQKDHFLEAIHDVCGDYVNCEEVLKNANIYLKKARQVEVVERETIKLNKNQIKKIKYDYSEEKCNKFLENVGFRPVFSQ